MNYAFINIDWSREELQAIRAWADAIGYSGTAKELKHAVEINGSIVSKLDDALAEAPKDNHTDNEQGDKPDDLRPR